MNPFLRTGGTPPAGRPVPLETGLTHFLSGRPLSPDHPAAPLSEVLFGMGCFWGAERVFWLEDGVWVTSVGYAGGLTPNPTYQEVCTGRTGHAEVVQVVFDPKIIDFDSLLRLFWENHDPTQGMRQGNDVGTQYRSAIFAADAGQMTRASASADAYSERLVEAGFAPLTTQIAPRPAYYLAEEYHQQYLAKNPDGYCGLGGTGVSCPIGVLS